MENNRPRGREKNVTGQASSDSMKKRGEGLGTGSVGRKEGYSSRPTSRPTGNGYQSSGGTGNQQFHSTGSSAHHGSSNVTRAGGIGIGGLILIVLAFLLFTGKCSGGGGGGLLSGLLGGGGSGTGTGLNTVTQPPANQGGNGGNSMFSGILGSLMGGDFSGGGTVSTGWVQSANTGKLNTSVAEGSRAKRTQILGNGRDVITMMVYMCGTDLESKHGMGTNDLQEMLNAKFGDNINLIVFTGGCKQWKNNVVSSSVNQVYKVENGGLKCLVQDAGRDSMTKPEVLTSFIQFCKQNYPANRYQLILWDHGCGSVSGYGYDEKNASSGSMSLKGINDAIRNSQTTFDFIGFDACLMATLETGLMLEPYVDYMIASEETEPGVGWYYTNWLTALGSNTSMPTVELGKMIVDEFVAECGRKCAGQSTTLSVVDLAELGNTVEAKFSDFAVATSNQVSGDYQAVSNARSSTREFAASSRIDQVDLVHLAHNLNTTESKALADAILGAVKYNKTSANMTNSYGLSIFFPYKKSSKVDSAVATYNAIGVDSAYSRCIQQFASMGVAGQAVGTTASAGGVSSPLSSLLGGSSAGNGSAQSVGGISDLLGGLLGGGGGGDLLSSLTGGSSDFFGRSIGDKEEVAQYISNHYFDPNNLVWKTENGKSVMQLSEDQWNLVQNLQLNVFYDDGSGYIDLGMDNIYDFTDDGKLLGEYDGTWLAINEQPVAYYVMNETYEGSNYTITGRVPVLLNGDRAELILVFTNDKPKGYIAGARPIYINGETETIAKGITELIEGDKIDLVCDYYNYNGEYVDSYRFGEQLTYSADMKISDVYLPDWQNAASATYLFTDLYAQEYWTPVLANK